MSNRTAKFASAILASLLAGAPLTTISHSAARAADDCLSGPKEETPEGSHWYYRIDRATKRHCWYLREEGGKQLQITAPISPPSAKPVSPKAEATHRPIEDARAELPPQTRVEQENSIIAGQQPTPATANVTGMESGQRASARDVNILSSVIASRWPAQSGANPTTNPPPDAIDPAVRANSTSRAQPPSVLAANQYAAADLSSLTSAYSMPARLAVLMGALALAGIIASAILKPGRPRRHRQARLRVRRDTIWEPTDDDRIVLSAPPGADVLPRRTGFARDPTGNRDDRIAKFFSQLSRRAPT
jgi:hypothetical protein